MKWFWAHRFAVCMVIFAGVAVAAIPASASVAESTPTVSSRVEPTGGLTLRRAIEAALASNPDLIAGAYELKARDARVAQAELRPNPEVSVDLENFAGSGTAHGTDALESTLSLSQIVELGSKRQHRTEVASLERDQARVVRQAHQLDVLAEVTRRFIAVVVAQERLDLETSATDLSQRTLDAISARVQAARSPEAERSRARIALARAQIEARQAQAELRAARVALAALWGSSVPAFVRAEASLFTLDAIEPFPTLAARLEQNPEFLRFASEARLREAQLRLARAQARPNLTLGVGVRRLGESGDTALVAAFSMPLPLYDRNQGAIREAEVRRAQIDSERAAALLRARATVHGLYQELVATRARLEALRTDALPYALQALEQSQYGFERGRFSYLELATALQELLGLRAAVIDAAADYHGVLTEIERLTGEPLAADPTQQETP